MPRQNTASPLQPVTVTVTATQKRFVIDMTVDVFDSGSSSERVTRLPSRNRVRLVYQTMCWLKPGDAVTVTASMECTNDFPWKRHKSGIKIAKNSMLGCGIVVSKNPAAISGFEPCESTAFNVTRAMHHGVATKVGMFKVPSSWAPDTYYFNFLGWSSNGLKVEQDYGRIQVMRIT